MSRELGGTGKEGSSVTTDRLLSLDENDVEWRMLLAQTAHELIGPLLSGRQSPHQQALWERLTHPRPGDYVFEVSSLWRQDVDGYRGVGFLQKVADEPYEDHDDDPAPTRDVWYVRYGPADEDVCRWENCTFRVIPIDRATIRREVEDHAALIVEATR